MADTELAEGPATAAEAGWGGGLVQVCLYQEKTSSWHGPCYYSLGHGPFFPAVSKKNAGSGWSCGISP